jgi:hypothetical protein
MQMIIEDTLWVLLFSVIISEVSILIDMTLNKLLPWRQDDKKIAYSGVSSDCGKCSDRYDYQRDR